MSILAIIGALIAIAILFVLVKAALSIASQHGWASSTVNTVIWAAAVIIALLIIAWALNIPVPFFRL